MKYLDTERILLRPFVENDFEAVHAYASVPENIQYMVWGPNEEEHTKAFIMQAIAKSRDIPCNNYQFAAVLKSSGKLIGACNLALSNREESEIGWILHRDYWKQGYGTEMGNKILEFVYGVLPSERRKGYATEMLRLALDKCKTLGIEKALITCDKHNIASARTIVKNRGIFENELPLDDGKIRQRYWIEVMSCG
jgi:predicted acetyltransferase